MFSLNIDPMWTLIAVMLAAGSFGGIINYYLSLRADPENTTLRKSVIVGIGASFLVPLFLNMISSNLIDSIKGTNKESGDSSKLLVFAGFCLVAAISSSAFIQTLSDRILKEAKDARKQAEEAKAEAVEAKVQVAEVHADVTPLINKATEPEPTAETAAAAALAGELSDKERQILKEFARSKYSRRTLRGLSADTHIRGDELETLLGALLSKGLVDKHESSNGTRWFMTAEGLNAAVSSQ
jgi:YLATT-like protein